MDVIVVGAGVVGKAFISTLLVNVNCSIVDPTHKENAAFCPEYSDIVFFCLPTPTRSDGAIDISIFQYYLDQLAFISFPGLVILKSTLTPQYLEKFKTEYPKLRLVYFPEFIREGEASYDMLNPQFHVLGGARTDTYDVDQFTKQHTKIHHCPVYDTDLVTASLVKYFINSWLATKVVFMNEFNSLHQNSNSAVAWDEFITIVSTDYRVGNSHLDVPGPDGQFGFGGMCFPKDTTALLTYAKESGIELSLINQAVEKNKIIRK